MIADEDDHKVLVNAKAHFLDLKIRSLAWSLLSKTHNLKLYKVELPRLTCLLPTRRAKEQAL